MGKHGEGSWKDGGHWGTTQNSGSQSNYYVGKSGSGDHCHMWNDKSSGKSGVEHRGSCKVCDDKKSGGK